MKTAEGQRWASLLRSTFQNSPLFSQERGHYNVTYPRGGYKTHCTIFNLHFQCILLGNELISAHYIFKFQQPKVRGSGV